MLLCLNFDGTLVPFADRPDEVCFERSLRDRLTTLARHQDWTMAIISGRALDDLRNRVGLPDVYYVGNHGLEISGPSVDYLVEANRADRETVGRFSATLAAKLTDVPGVWVENKGLTAAVHFRTVPETRTDDVRRIVHEALAANNHPFQLTQAHKVYDIRPRVNWNKGSAVNWIKERINRPHTLVVYVGDDATDEDAFSVLADDVTIKVGSADQSAAHYQLDGPSDVHRFLEQIVNEIVSGKS
jgi:trehalose-phosphatase